MFWIRFTVDYYSNDNYDNWLETLRNSIHLRRVSHFLFLWDSQSFSENLRKKAGAKREFYAASQIFSETRLWLKRTILRQQWTDKGE